jgi:pimeloyl-ACP methyl ester carboxylesterase
MKATQFKREDLAPKRKMQSVVIYTDAPGKMNASYWLKPIENSVVSMSPLPNKQEQIKNHHKPKKNQTLNMKPRKQSIVISSLPIYRSLAVRVALTLLAVATTIIPLQAADDSVIATMTHYPTLYKSIKVNGLDIFYREAGPTNAPTLILLHGFPTSSYMFRNLIPALADKYHIIAPDYPGYGHSSMPSVSEFDYTFDNLADVVDTFIQELGIEHYSLYVMDYGAPVGFRIAAKHPERVQSLIVQNGNAYDEGLLDFWKPFRAYWSDRSDANAAVMKNSLLTIDATHWQYTNGVQNVDLINPDNWLVDQTLMDRPGNKDIQLALFYSYGSNPPLYPKWQEYFRQYQPPMLIVWGKNDYIFPAEGAYPYLRDLKNIDFHLLNTGHFALEEDGDEIASLIRIFLAKQNIKP